MQVDKGAIQFVLQGANIMCPGDFLLHLKLITYNNYLQKFFFF